MWKLLVTIGLIFLCCFGAKAQKASFTYYNSSDGLSGNFTANLTQDNKGFLWLLNDYKLHRFDGRNFVRYPLSENQFSFSGKRFLGLSSYQDSLLAISSESEFYIVNPEHDEWTAYPYPEEVAANLERFHFLEVIGDNCLFIHYRNNSKLVDVWRFANGQFTLTKFRDIESPSVGLTMAFDEKGTPYVGTHDKIFKIKEGQGKKRKVVQLKDCPGCNVRTLLFQPKNAYVVVGTPKGNRIYLLDVKAGALESHPINRFLAKEEELWVTGVKEDGTGNFWAIGVRKNLSYYDAAQDTLYVFQSDIEELIPELDRIVYVETDNTGNSWILTSLGLIKATLQTVAFDHYFSNRRAVCNGFCSFRGLTEDAEGHIYASFYRGIAKLDPDTKEELALFTNDSYPFPWGLDCAGEKVWLNNGQLLHTETGAQEAVAGSTSDVAEAGIFSRDGKGTLWWVHLNELFYLDTLQGRLLWVKELELPHKIIYLTEAMYAGPNSEHVWIGHKASLLRYDPRTKEQRWFDATDWKLPVSRILAIEEDAEGAVWLATDLGLLHFNSLTQQTQHFTEQDGLPNNFVSGLLMEGDSCIWLSTNNGLSRFHIAKQSFINFFEKDGLTHNEFNRLSFFKAKNGRMFFGGLRGINAFFPQEIMEEYRSRNEAAQMVLSSLEFVDVQEDTIVKYYGFERDPKVELNYWKRSFTFEYALTDYRSPEEVYYSYQMEGYEDSWSTPSQFNFTRFSNLPAGDYTFRVKARDSDGQWHRNQLAVMVTVLPPWWETGWAYFVYAILVLLAAYGIYQYLKKRLLLQNELNLKAEEAKRFKELDTFKSRLYTNLTHEFRTPLTIILGMVQQIRNQPTKYLDNGTRLIENNGKNLLRLVNQLLDLSKLEDQSFQLDLKQGDIVPFLSYVTESFQTYANSKNLSLRFFSNQESLMMDYDPVQIQQVLTNLISNALKFTPPDGDVQVKLMVQGQQLQIAVEDTGIGIAAKDLPHVFDRFYQVDNSTTRVGEGTGIGLAHTRELVRLMGGEIRVESEEGKGTRFLVSLPIHTKAEIIEGPAAPVQDPILTTTSEEVPVLGTQQQDLPQVLIIEDNRDVVIYLKSCLAEQYQVQVAYNGKIGIEKALQQVPDLIISDVMMPEKDGYEVCDTLKNDERTSHVPIILLTAKADHPSKLAGLKRGADVYLIKPFDKEELLVRLEMLMERQQRMMAHFSNKFLGQPKAEELGVDEVQIENAFLQKVKEVVAKHYHDEDFALPQLCQKIGMSRSQLFRKMRALIGISPSAFIRDYRLNRAKELLQTTDQNVSEVAFEVGYKNLAHFSKSFQAKYGHPPSTTHK